MKVGMGTPAWLGALVIAGPPGAVTGLLTAHLERWLPAWILFPCSLIILLASCVVWIALMIWIENWRDRRSDPDSQQKPE
jgi:hypothetical protein